MRKNVDLILEQRLHRVGRQQRLASGAFSFLFHLLVVATAWFVPELLAKLPVQIESIPVMVVSPAVLGIEQPPPQPRWTPPPPEPPPPEPPPVDGDTMVLAAEREKEEVKPPPPPRRSPPPPPAVKPPPKREGSPFGKSLGAQTSRTRVGVEDPNFTYGYYLDRVVSVISGNWVRPPVGAEVEEAILYFRILRDGTIAELRVAEASGSETFDVAALRAVEASSPLPPLPKGYKKDYLGINLIVR